MSLSSPAVVRLPRRRAVLLYAAAAALVLAACGGGPLRNPFVGDGNSTTQIRITIDNRNFADVHVYAMTPSGSRSLGVVGGNQSGNFRLEWRQVDNIYFRLNFLAGRTYTTESLNVSPGNSVEVEIPVNPTNIILRVR